MKRHNSFLKFMAIMASHIFAICSGGEALKKTKGCSSWLSREKAKEWRLGARSLTPLSSNQSRFSRGRRYFKAMVFSIMSISSGWCFLFLECVKDIVVDVV